MWKNGLKKLKDLKAFMEYVYKNTEEYHPSRKCNLLIAFDNMIADMISNKKLSPIVTD